MRVKCIADLLMLSQAAQQQCSYGSDVEVLGGILSSVTCNKKYIQIKLNSFLRLSKQKKLLRKIKISIFID